MQDSKLIRSFQALNSAEVKRFLKFLKSPFFNASKTVLNLYYILRVEYPDFKNPKLTTEKIFKKLFPNKVYSKKRVQNLMSELHALLEEYLVVLQVEREKLTKEKLLLRAYRDRPNCYPAFIKKSDNIHDYLDKLPYRDEEYFFEKEQLRLLNYSHPGLDIQSSKVEQTLELIVEDFNSYKAIASIKLDCAIQARLNTFTTTSVLEKIEKKKQKSIIVLDIYKKLKQFQETTEDKKQLKKLSEMFIENLAYFRQEDRGNIIKILLNYFMRFINKGTHDMIPSCLALYKAGLQHDCFSTYGKITEFTFQNIITIGIHCKEYQWTENFIKDHTNKLDENIKEEALSIGMAQLNYKKENFEEALNYLNHNFQEQRFILKSKSLSVRIWYELYEKDDQYFDLLFNQIDAFEKFLRREKNIALSRTKAYLAFISYTRKIAKSKYMDYSYKELHESIKKETNLIVKNWLLEKTKIGF